MPTNVVKSKSDEKDWRKAKAIAHKEGKGNNYAYIMGIYKKMNPNKFDKEACVREFIKRSEDKEKSTSKRVLAGAGGLGAYKLSKNPATGRVRVYHGTSKKNWESIKEKGLDPRKGGEAGAGKTHRVQMFQDTSKDKVHFTRSKGIANSFNRFVETGKPPDELPKSPKEVRKVLSKGKTVKADIPYEMYSKAKADPHLIAGVKSKYLGATTGEKIPVEDIRGAKKSLVSKYKRVAKNLPKYIKKHPGRFGVGVAGMAGAAKLLNYTISPEKNI